MLVTDDIPEASSHGDLLGFERTAGLSTQPAEVIAEEAVRFGPTDDITGLSLAAM